MQLGQELMSVKPYWVRHRTCLVSFSKLIVTFIVIKLGACAYLSGAVCLTRLKLDGGIWLADEGESV